MATELLQTRFGFSDFRPGQAEALESLLAGRHTLVVMPTGAGKSLVYQLAALKTKGVTLVISPLISLMQDQVTSLARRGIPATFINSSLSAPEQTRRLESMAAGQYTLVYVAPERLRSVAFGQALSAVNVGLLAVDEAHCISEWGHDFRPDYLRIAAARREIGSPVTAALTATATVRVQEEIIRLLGLGQAERIVTGFNRPNLAFEVRYATDPEAKLRALRALLAEDGGTPAIIYTGTRRDSEEVAAFIAEVLHIEALSYHAGLPGDVRDEVQAAFMSGDAPVVAATSAFGMGIDRADVRLVVHFSVPGTIEAYYQEAGRAGRDGQPARAMLLYAPQDRALQEFFIENDALAEGDLETVFGALEESVEGDTWVSMGDLSLETGFGEVKIRLGLAELEKAGMVQRLGDEGTQMLLSLGAWDRGAARAAYQAAVERQRFRYEQLGRMVGYAESNACRRQLILDHFGDPADAVTDVCCDNCTVRAEAAPRGGGERGDFSALATNEKTALVILDAARRLKWGVGMQKLTQLLHGSSAAAIRKMGYDRNPYYGRLAGYKQSEVGQMIQQLVEMRYLKAIGGQYPVLSLTPFAEEAIKARSAIPLRLPRELPPKAAARKRQEREAGGTVALTETLFRGGMTPPEIAAERGLDVDTIYGHLAHLIASKRLALEDVVPPDVTSFVTNALEEVGSAAALAPVKELLPDGISYGQIRCVAENWSRETGGGPAVERMRDEGVLWMDGRRKVWPAGASRDAEAGPDTDVAAFLSRSHPQKLRGSWECGWSLGFHSAFSGGDWQRSPVGDLAYRLKYQGDTTALDPLVEQAIALLADHPELSRVEALIPVPPSVERDFDHVDALAAALAARIGLPVWRAVEKVRQTAPQKELETLAQKRHNVAGAFFADGSVAGRRVLVVDDLFDSGATLEEITLSLLEVGAAAVLVLAMTRTIHSDG